MPQEPYKNPFLGMPFAEAMSEDGQISVFYATLINGPEPGEPVYTHAVIYDDAVKGSDPVVEDGYYDQLCEALHDLADRLERYPYTPGYEISAQLRELAGIDTRDEKE